MSRVSLIALAGMLAMTCASEASAKTVVIYTDSMTLERRAVILETPGRDRVLLCVTPPAVAGCREVRAERQR